MVMACWCTRCAPARSAGRWCVRSSAPSSTSDADGSAPVTCCRSCEDAIVGRPVRSGRPTDCVSGRSGTEHPSVDQFDEPADVVVSLLGSCGVTVTTMPFVLLPVVPPTFTSYFVPTALSVLTELSPDPALNEPWIV